MQHQWDNRRTAFLTKNIAVLLGGMSPERAVSLQSGTAIREALQRRGYRVCCIDVTPQLAEQVQEHGVEVAFLALHGPFGEDGTVQGLLELMGIPYTGSGVLASALAMNKAATKKILSYHGLPTPAFQVLHAGAAAEEVTMPLPLVIKPAEGGSTIGVSIVHSRDELPQALAGAAQYDHEVLVEAYIQGRELTVGVVEGEPLPLIEIQPLTGFYDYTAKYHSGGSTQYIIDPQLPEGLREYIQQLACSTFQALGCSGAARIDFILNPEGTPFILEVNTIPGMTASSLLPKAAHHAGIDFDSLVERILLSAQLHKTSRIKAGGDVV